MTIASNDIAAMIQQAISAPHQSVIQSDTQLENLDGIAFFEEDLLSTGRTEEDLLSTGRTEEDVGLGAVRVACVAILGCDVES